MRAGKHSLATEDREFFALLAEVIFSNPFSFDRERLERTLGLTANLHPDEHYYAAVIPRLEQCMAKLEKQGITTIKHVQGKDRELFEYACLFRIYHHYVDRFDEHIQHQIEHGDMPARVDFASELLADLMTRGFGETESCRYLALFFQLRRAYFFIDCELVGDAPCMRRLRHALWNNVFTADVRLYAHHLWNHMEDFSTLLLGETGTGKGAAAAAIGRSGLIPFEREKSRFKYSFTRTFIQINLSEFSENLIESELFGHRKGAFTGAIDHYKGVFERCNPHGSLFLDEIGDVSIPVQIKLLNVIQERRFTPVGNHESRRFEGRVIAATNQCLEQRRQQGLFRDDFYYRLSSDVIHVPTLHQRLQESPDELPQLVSLLIARLTGRRDKRLEDRVIGTIRRDVPPDYTWPGNVRELEQAVRRVLINDECRMSGTANRGELPWLEKLKQGELSAQELLGAYSRMLYTKFGTYEEVAKRTGLDRRTAKKYIQNEKGRQIAGP